MMILNHVISAIHSIKSRIKKPVSLAKKLRKKGLPVSVDSIKGNINDVAGVRVICSFVDDIYTISEMLTSQTDITLISQKDYIEHPKPNGYRSLHLIVEIPVFFADNACGSTDTNDRNGLLGKFRSSASI